MSECARRRILLYRMDERSPSPLARKIDYPSGWNWARASRREEIQGRVPARSYRSCRILVRKRMSWETRRVGNRSRGVKNWGMSGWVRGRWPWTRGGGSKVSVEGRSREPGCSFSPDSVSQGQARGCCFSSVSLDFSCRPSRGWFNRYFQWQREERRVIGSHSIAR